MPKNELLIIYLANNSTKYVHPPTYGLQSDGTMYVLTLIKC